MGRYSTPIQGIIDRLKFHATTGQTPVRRLDGLKVLDIPEVDVEGDKDFPSVRLFVPDFVERFAPARNVDGTIQVKLLIATSRAKGIPELMSWIEKILDALQRDQTDQRSAIPGLARHFDCDVKDAYPKDRSLNAPLTLLLQPAKHEIGSRAS